MRSGALCSAGASVSSSHSRRVRRRVKTLVSLFMESSPLPLQAFQQGAGDHEPLNLGSPLLDGGAARVSIVPLHGVFARVAVGSVNLAREVRDTIHHL